MTRIRPRLALRRLLYLLPAFLLIAVMPGLIYLIFGLFAAIWLFDLQITGHRSRRQVLLGLFFTLWLAGMIVEISAWIEVYWAGEWGQGGSLHPQLAYTLLAGLGLYGAWALSWVFLLTRYRFSLWEAFWLPALMGIAVEQQGAILIAGIASFPAGLFLWAVTAIVYGASVAGPYWFWQPQLRETRPSRWKWLVAGLTVLIVGTVVGLGWERLFPLPPPKPVSTHPFW